MKPTLLILAAGMGSRYGGLKQVDQLGPSGETLLEYSIFDAIRAGFGKVVFVIRQDIEAAFKAHFGQKFEAHIPVQYVYQEIDKVPEGIAYPIDRTKPWGTAHAVLMAQPVINEPFVMINADDFYGQEAFATIAAYLEEVDPESLHFAMVAYRLDKTLSAHGSVSRGVCEVDQQGFLNQVVERTKILRQEKGIVYFDGETAHPLAEDTPVSMNLFGFTAGIFSYIEQYFKEFLIERGHEPKSEFYVPMVITRMLDEGLAKLKVLRSDAQWFGVTYRDDKERVMNKLAALVERGAYPPALWPSSSLKTS